MTTTSDIAPECPHLPAALETPLKVDAECPAGPSRQLQEVQAQAPVTRGVMPDGQVVWLVTGYEESRAVLADRRFSASPQSPGYPAAGAFGLQGSILGRTMQRQDPPDHTRLRRLVAREFTPKRIGAFQPIVDSAVAEVLDSVTGRDVIDFVPDIAQEIPALVTDGILGIPAKDREYFKKAASALFNVHDGPERYLESERRISDYLEELIASGGAVEDRIIARVAAHCEAGELTSGELVAFIMHLVVAGHETTTNQMSLSTWSLLTRDDGRDLAAVTKQQWAQTVEELLRFHAIVRGGPRRAALEDVMVGDVVIRAGEGVYVSIWTANHDARAYPDPDEWGFEAPAGAPEHLAFGHGLHQCLGQHLARAEMVELFARFFERFPAVTIDDASGAVEFGSDSTNYGMHHLRLRLGGLRTRSG